MPDDKNPGGDLVDSTINPTAPNPTGSDESINPAKDTTQELKPIDIDDESLKQIEDELKKVDTKKLEMDSPLLNTDTGKTKEDTAPMEAGVAGENMLGVQETTKQESVIKDKSDTEDTKIDVSAEKSDSLSELDENKQVNPTALGIDTSPVVSPSVSEPSKSDPNLNQPSPTATTSQGEVPLAFAGNAGVTSAASTINTTPPLGGVSSEPKDLPPLPPTDDDEGKKPKKKSGVGKVLAAVFGVFVLLGGLGFGYYYFNSQTAQIAQVTTGQEVPCNGGVSGGCGAAPNPLPTYSKTATVNAPGNGQFVVYYRGGSGSVGNFTVNGQVRNINLTSGRIATGINVQTGDEIVLTKVTEPNQGSPACADEDPHPNPKYQGTGWIAPESGLCGSGLAGPPTGGKCYAFEKIDVSGFVSQADSGDQILSQQCWADWREWPGDYDFNDYFIMLAIEPEFVPPTVSCNSITSSNNNPSLDDEVVYTCSGSVTDNSTLSYDFRYNVDGGTYTVIQSTTNTATIAIEQSGNWQVQCRACANIQGTRTCSSQWQGVN